MTRSRVALASLVGVLLAANLVLVAILLTREPAGGASGGYQPPPFASPSALPSPSATVEAPAPSATPTPSITPSAEPEQPIVGAPATRQLVLVGSQVAWRTSVGSCGEPSGATERTTDGGLTWQTTQAPGDVVVRLRAFGPLEAAAVTADAACESAYMRTWSGGETWSEVPAALPTTWHLSPADRNLVIGPAATAAPCDAGTVDLAVTGQDVGIVLCRDGSVLASGDGGSAWAPAAQVSAPLAIAASGETVVLAHQDPTCDGVAVLRLGEGQETVASGCAPLAIASDTPVALGLVDSDLWVWAGDSLAVSSDLGGTWQ